MLKKYVTQNLLDTFFPRRCLGCKTFDTLLCPSCLAQNLVPHFITPKNHQPISQLFFLSHYHNPFIRTAITEMKFQRLPEIAAILGQYLATFLKNELLAKKLSSTIVIPIPLHPRRLSERGFNQSHLLAAQISKQLNLPVVDNILIKKHYTLSQTSVELFDRPKNIANVFSLNKKTKHLLHNYKKILLVDDVVTTGSTIAAAANALNTECPQKILVAAIAQG